MSEAVVKLTRREVEVLTLIAEGIPPKQVAEQLFVAKRTVDFHEANIREKLGVHNRVAAIRVAQQRGLLTVGEVGAS